MLNTLHQQLETLAIELRLEAQLGYLDVGFDLDFAVHAQLTSLNDLLENSEAKIELSEAFNNVSNEHHAAVDHFETVEFHAEVE